MSWKIIEINTDEYVQLYFNNLLIKRFNEKILINISDIDFIIFNNDRTTISVKLLNALTKSNVAILFMNSENIPQTHAVPVNGHHMSLKILEKQLNWKHQYKSNLWKNIIENKISNQITHLKIQKINYFEIINFYNNVRQYDITNREGHAAKVYWHKLFGINFLRDYSSIKNPIINSMLNYGYSIIRSLVIKSIIKKGLDPRISIFHKSFTNFFALASDLMEPYRPLVDQIVYKNKDVKFFTIEVKEKLKEVLDKKVKINNSNFYINDAIEKQVDYLISNKGHLWISLWE